jgi:hypothetical protein
MLMLAGMHIRAKQGLASLLVITHGQGTMLGQHGNQSMVVLVRKKQSCCLL